MKDRGHPRYFKKVMNGESYDDSEGLTLDQRRLLKVIKDHPYITRGEISGMMPSGNESLKNDLQILIRKRIVARNGDGPQATYLFITAEELKARVIGVLIKRLIAREIDESTFLRLREELEKRF
jgi:hypothetical protein